MPSASSRRRRTVSSSRCSFSSLRFVCARPSRRSSTPSVAWTIVPFMRTSTRRRSSGFVARSSNSVSERRSCSNTEALRRTSGAGDGGRQAWRRVGGALTIPEGVIHPQHFSFPMTASLVALTSTTKDIGGLMRVRLNEAYVHAVRAAGLAPVVVPPIAPDELGPVLDAVSGIVLTGGEDVDPAEYGASMGPSTDPPHRERDRCELAMVRLAHQRRMPTLAICRGIQVMNVALGGTLVQDIASECATPIRHDQSSERDSRVHGVTI